MEPQPKPIIVIVGQTASGKSELAIKLAQKYNGEIICADSRTIYKGLNIGTAKPSSEDQKRVRHHGLDLIDPDQKYSAAEFKSYANKTVQSIHQRAKIPIIVGGTGLYIDGFIYDFSFNKSQQTKRELPKNVLVIGLKIDKEQLLERIAARVDKMFNSGLIEEVQNVLNRYGDEAPALLAPGYKAVKEYIKGTLSIEEATAQFIRNDKDLAKRQMTWFKRSKDINWCQTNDEVYKVIDAFFSKFDTMDL